MRSEHSATSTPHDDGNRALIAKLRQGLDERRRQIREAHDRGLPPIQVCSKLTAATDTALRSLWDAALGTLSPDEATKLSKNCVLVAHGGYGRRQLAPHSDIDLMVLFKSPVRKLAEQLSKRLIHDVFDLGLDLGQSLRTPEEAQQLAKNDPVIGTSLVESRPLVGAPDLFESYFHAYQTNAQRRGKSACVAFCEARREEREKYGETVYLLEPNIKRSRGGLRDVHMLRWLWFAQTGVSDLDRLRSQGVLSKFDHRRLCSSRDFLLRTRNELHFHTGKQQDLLHRENQIHLAEKFGYVAGDGLRPVERFMSDYFRHAAHVSFMANRLEELTRPKPTMARMLDPVMARSIEKDYRVGLHEVAATSSGRDKLRRHLDEVLRVVDVARDHDRRIAQETWYTIYRAAPDLGNLTPSAIDRFLEILAKPDQLGELLRRLHELGVLEKVVPAFAKARCLLQFNQYHKFTVDEHCLRAVERATSYADREDRLGAAYRSIEDKALLHLALLIHDLGKGQGGDHSVIGETIARELGDRLQLSGPRTDLLALLVRHHLEMSLLAFRRDTGDPEVVRSFANLVGSPEALSMLFVLTCADMDAVGPGVLTNWKVNVLADLYDLTQEQLAETSADRRSPIRQAVWQLLKQEEQDDGWFKTRFEDLPDSFLAARSAASIATTLRRLDRAARNDSDQPEVWGNYLEDGTTFELIVAVASGAGQGSFSNLAGALSSKGLGILAAEKVVLEGDLVLHRFTSQDPNASASMNAAEANRRVQSLTTALRSAMGQNEVPRFPKRWGDDQQAAGAALSAQPNRVTFDTTTSEACTLIEVFTIDRVGLLYELSCALDAMSLVVRSAKIATSLDQVVDVFYVTEADGSKPTSSERLEAIHDHLMQVIEAAA